MNALISAGELIRLSREMTVVLLDARGGPDAVERFSQLHLKGSRHIHLENDLSDIGPDPARGGRHPLPSPDKFFALLGGLGVDAQTMVVACDDRLAANAAARLWWMLKAAGHDLVRVLDGGTDAAIKAGFPSESGTPQPAIAKSYPPPIKTWLVADMDEVEKVARDPLWKVIDVREAERYRGETEPYDLVAGHIPGAINIPYTENLGADGHFLAADVLNKKYRAYDLNMDRTIVHCGSGVTACHTLLAMYQAGLGLARLYPGSFSEWSRNNKPIGP